MFIRKTIFPSLLLGLLCPMAMRGAAPPPEKLILAYTLDGDDYNKRIWEKTKAEISGLVVSHFTPSTFTIDDVDEYMTCIYLPKSDFDSTAKKIGLDPNHYTGFTVGEMRKVLNTYLQQKLVPYEVHFPEKKEGDKIFGENNFTNKNMLLVALTPARDRLSYAGMFFTLVMLLFVSYRNRIAKSRKKNPSFERRQLLGYLDNV